MNKILAVLALSGLLFSGCQAQESQTDPETDSRVDLSSETEMTIGRTLEASFMSANQTFAYSFKYDENLMQLMDAALSAQVSNIDPNFKLANGAELVGFTTWASEVDMVRELAATKLYGSYQVYESTIPDGICTVEQAVVPHLEEALVLRVKTCPDQDPAVSSDALNSLLKSLKIKDL